jgi:hypothetical protein
MGIGFIPERRPSEVRGSVQALAMAKPKRLTLDQRIVGDA